MLFTLYLLQQKSSDGINNVQYSVGLVIVCLLVLLGLWLPDILRKD